MPKLWVSLPLAASHSSADLLNSLKCQRSGESEISETRAKVKNRLLDIVALGFILRETGGVIF